jgi:hypothetical protein
LAKWVDDGKSSDDATVLQVFGEQRFAARFDGGSNNQGVVKRQPVIGGKRPRGVVNVKRER